MFKFKTALSVTAISIVALVMSGCKDDNPVASQANSVTTTQSAPISMNKTAALAMLDDLSAQINPDHNATGRRAKNFNFEGEDNLLNTLPEIATYEITAKGKTGPNYTTIEIMSSSEKASDGNEAFFVDVVNNFNRKSFELSDGSIAQIDLRKVPSGLQYMYLASKKHQPEAFTPSNELWASMAKARGVTIDLVTDSVVRNYAGIVVKNSAYSELVNKYGTVDVGTIVDATVAGDIVMGYTDPFTSSTGLNYMVNVLHLLAGGDEAKMLSPEVASALVQFQAGVPMVQVSTLQTRDSVIKSGFLDAFVMERQTFVSEPLLNNGSYKFIPFGVRHDNPLYAVTGQVDPTEREVLNLISDFIKTPESLALAEKFGFNENSSHVDAYKINNDANLIEAQKIWKNNKDAGRPVVAVFVADRSGSMSGAGILGLKDALLKSADFIKSDNHIGLVGFSSDVNVSLPIKKFNLNQKAEFIAAVQDIQTGGGTAMYNGALIGMKMIQDKLKEVPNAKPILFVLTDGRTDQGFSYQQTAEMFKTLGVPIYTIAYGSNINGSELQALSSIVEATTIKSGEGQVAFKLSSLLNSQM